MAQISVTDDTDRKVELKAPAQRIVSLAPFLTELAYSAGAGGNVVAVSAFSDYPEAAKSLPQVASAVGVSLEPLLALTPDLVLAWRDSTRDADLERLRSLGIAVYVSRPQRLEDVPRVLGDIGVLTGRDVAPAAADFRARIEALRRAHAKKVRMRAFLEVWHQPLTTISGPHWMNEALEVCGATNLFSDLSGAAPQVSWEELYARAPQVIVGAGSSTGGEARFRAAWKERGTLAAVRDAKLVYVEADLFLRPTLRLAEGVAQLCAGLDRVR